MWVKLSDQEKKNRRIKRIYLKAKTGILKWTLLGIPLRHMVLTTSLEAQVRNNPEQLRIDAKELKKRIKRVTPLKLVKQGFITTSDLRRYYSNKPINEALKLEYQQIRTNEGNGVLHLLVASDFIPHYWISKNWEEIHYSPNVSIRLVDKNEDKKISGYLANQMCKYLSDQDCTYIRTSASQNWIYKGWAIDYASLKHSITHYHYSHDVKRYDYGYTHVYYSREAYFKNQTTPPPPQTQLYPNEYQTDKDFFIQEWNKHIENKFGGLPHY